MVCCFYIIIEDKRKGNEKSQEHEDSKFFTFLISFFLFEYSKLLFLVFNVVLCFGS
jgi:hypothetical protein